MQQEPENGKHHTVVFTGSSATLNENLNEIITVLEEIADSNEEHKGTRNKARTLVHGSMTFSFFAFLSFWAAVLRSVN